MNGSFSVVFPLLPEPNGPGTYQTVVPTWQAVPFPWGDLAPSGTDIGFGNRDISNIGGLVPVPSGAFGDRPDVFTISKVGIIPRYVKGGAPVLGDIPTDNNGKISIVVENVKTNIQPGIIKASCDYRVVFSNA